jgi:transcriptional regulator with XRE-family HTH domain
MKKSIFSRDYQLLHTLLRDLRKEAGVTQVELAHRLNETQSAVSKCERGERRLDLVQLRAWCQAVGIPLSKLVAEFEKRVAKKGR